MNCQFLRLICPVGLTCITYTLYFMRELPDDMVALVGPKRIIAYARDSAGNLRAKVLLESEEVPEGDKAKFIKWMQYICDSGLFPRGDKFSKERGEIWSFKGNTYRLAAFQHGKYICLTHGFKKEKRRWSEREFDEAERIRRAHMAWANTRR